MKRLGSIIWNYYSSLSLVKQIFMGILLGIIIALLAPQLPYIGMLGKLFVSALKAIAPILVFFLVVDSLAHQRKTKSSSIKNVLILYLVSMLLAGITAVFITLYFSPTVVLHDTPHESGSPSNLAEVVSNMCLGCVQNPLEAIAQANYIGILFWAVIFGLLARKTSETTHIVLDDIADLVSKVISVVIRFAPLGVMGLMFTAIDTGGMRSLGIYLKLILVLVGIMLVVALVINPLIVYFTIRRNPYPLVWRCLKDSGLTAFFTRSSAANIPVNIEICKQMELDPDTYMVTIPLGSTINMCGASVTITTLTLATVATLNLNVTVGSAIFMCIIATISACGSAGVAGGSLLLIPLACSMFGISDTIAMQVVATGFLIGVVQDSCETALNSSSDMLFTAAADIAARSKEQDSKVA